MKKKFNILSKLTRFRLSSMVSFSAAVGYFLYDSFQWGAFVLLTLGVFLLAAGTSALNQIQERNFDALMKRTEKRPIPNGDITIHHAYLLTVLILFFGSLALYKVSSVAMLLGLSNLFFYNLLYTKLKRITAFAVLPGSVVGAIPPLMGWAAAGGSVMDKPALFLAFFMFLWQVPHFWLLLMYFKKDYIKAGFKNVTDRLDEMQVKRLTFLWAALTSSFLFLFPFFFQSINEVIFMLLAGINCVFVYLFYTFLFKENKKNMRMAFMTINLYMPLVLILLQFV